jgi:hypothetical protein
MPAQLQEVLQGFFSRLFPHTQDIEVEVDASADENHLFVDIRLAHSQGFYRFSDLRNIPARIKLGRRYVRISQKNRSTLRSLADWDPSFDPRKGFVFYEKDVPEILNYLRTKASVRFEKNADRVAVDNHPLEYVHEVNESERGLEIKTSLSDADEKIQIKDQSEAKFLEDSKFAHAQQGGYYRKPPKKEYRTFRPELGVTALVGDQIPLFLLYDLKRIHAETKARVAAEVDAQRVFTAPFDPKVSLNVDGPWIWFDVRYQADRFQIPYQEVEKSDPGHEFMRREDTWIQLDRKTHDRVAHNIHEIPEVERVQGQFRAPTYHFNEVQSLLEQVARVDTSEAYAKFVRSLEDFSRIEEQPLPYSLKNGLRVYQKHGYDWLCFLREYGLNGILADEMGLGKTVQALAALLENGSLPQAKTSLIVCPPSVLSAWEEEIRRVTSPLDFRTARYVGPNRRKILTELNQVDGLLTTYNIVVKDVDTLSKVAWDYVILDEAQKIKNNETATAKCCKRLIAKHKLALTGTPLENRLSELWSIYDFLMPSYLGGPSQFRNKFEIPIMKHSNKQASEELKRRINPFKLRRLKSQVASELPPKIPMERFCELTPEQAHLYKQYAASEQQKIRNMPGSTIRIDTGILAAILRLKQICCHPALVTPDKDRI